METVRKSNRSILLKFINDNGPVSRKDLADVTGLTPAAVTQICNDLLAERILLETGRNAKSHGAGRKKILLDINYDVYYVFAITIEPEQSVIAVSNLRGEKVAIKKVKTDASVKAEDFLQYLAACCRGLVEEKPQISEKTVAAGVGITGLVDSENGSSTKAYGIWDYEVDVRRILSEELQMPVYVENNVNAFAMAELFYGAGKEHDNLMVIKWGPGVGCAMIIDQSVYRGRHRKAAELGHFILDKDGERCHCGRRGCLETKISYQALNKIQPFAEEKFGEIYEKAEREGTAAGFDEANDLFARSIVNSATIMAPNRIILSGSLFRSEIIRKKLIAACGEYDSAWGEGRVIYTGLSDKEEYIGPVALCVKNLLF